VSGGTKQRPINALTASLLPPTGVRCDRLTAEFDLAHRLEATKGRSISDRSPPAFTLLV